MDSKPDQDLVGQVQAAHALLDEQPPPAVRAAILKAAAAPQAGQAHPAPQAVSRRAAVAAPWWRLRPPLAVGSAMMVGVLAVGLALHVERNEPAAPKAALPEPSVQRQEATARAQPMPAQPSPPPLRLASANSASQVTPANAPAPVPAADVEHRSAARDAGAAPISPVASGREAANTFEAQAAASPAASDAGSASSRLRAAPSANILRAIAQPHHANADEWLKYIRELRDAHRDADAEREVKEFRAAYPAAGVPQDLLTR